MDALARLITMSTFTVYRDKFVWGLVALLTSGAIAWCGWVTVQLLDASSRNAIQDEVVTRLDSFATSTRSELIHVIEKNTDAINALKVELAKLQK